MSTPEDVILANVVYAIVNTTPPGTQSTGPQAFAESIEPTLNGEGDRMFMIDGDGAFENGNRGLDNQVNGRFGNIEFSVVLRRINNGMSQRLFTAAVLADVRGITDRVQRYVSEQLGIAGACVSESKAYPIKFADGEVTIQHWVIPFKVEFQATQVTS